MRVVPETINQTWIETLADDDILDIERRLHAKFSVIERREKKLHGARYQLFKGSAELLLAWDRWSRVSNATRERSLRIRREPTTPVVE